MKIYMTCFILENVHFTYALQYFKQVQINVCHVAQDDFNNILVAKHIPYMCPVISNLISIPTLVNMWTKKTHLLEFFNYVFNINSLSKSYPPTFQRNILFWNAHTLNFLMNWNCKYETEMEIENIRLDNFTLTLY